MNKLLLLVLSSLSMIFITVSSFAQNVDKAVLGSNDELLDWNELYRNGLVNQGDTARVARVLHKARMGEPVAIAVIGGSITSGAGASSEATCWASRLFKWFQDSYPKTEFTFINAGIGATGSKLGAFRVKSDVMDKKPDLVIIEFAVNDPHSQDTVLCMEGLVRQILKHPNNPAVIQIFTMNKDGYNVQDLHSKVGFHYNLPMLSYRDALWPEIEEGRLTWDDIAVDAVHPNDLGHYYIAGLLIRYLQTLDSSLEKFLSNPITSISEPLIGDAYEFTELYTAKTAKTINKTGWMMGGGSKMGRSWLCKKADNLLEFNVFGSSIEVVYRYGDPPLGKVEVTVDDLLPVILVGHGDLGWGWYMRTETIASDLEPGEHRLRFRLLDDIPPGGGREFEIFAVGTSGVKR